MTKRSIINHPAKITEVGARVLRCRLSLKETQAEFAQRFRVSGTTIYKWEAGEVAKMQRIYFELLQNLEKRLNQEGRLIPMDFVAICFKEDEERKDLQPTEEGMDVA